MTQELGDHHHHHYHLYPVTVSAQFDGNNRPYFLYADEHGDPLRSPLVIPVNNPPYDGISFTQAGNETELRLWAAVTHTLDNTKPAPERGDLETIRKGAVRVLVPLRSKRGTVLVFERLDDTGAIIELVPTPDPVTENPG